MRRMLLMALLGLSVSPVMAMDVCKPTITQSARDFTATTSSTYALTLYKGKKVVTSVTISTTPEHATPVQVSREMAYVEKLHNGQPVPAMTSEGFNMVLATEAPTATAQRVNYHVSLAAIKGMDPVKGGPGDGIERPVRTTVDYCGQSDLAVGDKDLQAIPSSPFVLEVARVN